MIRYPYDEPPAPGKTIEIVPGVLWLQMPLPMSLNHINLYMLEDHDGWWIVDTGIALGDTEALWEQIFATALKGKPVKAVVCTHYHPDHIGMAGWLCERWRVPLYMTSSEYFSGLAFSLTEKEHFAWTNEEHLRGIGYSDKQIQQSRDNYGGLGPYIKPLPVSYRRLQEGSSTPINGNRWRVVIGSGHSPEHACLYCENLNLLISGDQLIPRITSNISVSAIEPEANPLKEWFSSLEHLLDVIPDETQILPAHNAPFYGAHFRLRQLIEHHEEHLLALEQACLEEQHSAMELLPVLFNRKLDRFQIGMAVGECLAHLNFLRFRGQLARDKDESGVYRYRSVDETLAQRLRQQRHRADDAPPIQV